MSKQMDFQFLGWQFRDMIGLVERLVGNVPHHELERALVREFPDEKERKIARATIIALVKCYDARRDVQKVKKIIVWRDTTGKPDQIQIEF